MSEDVREAIRKYALQNAVFYDGEASSKAVMGKVMAEMPEQRARAQEIVPLVDEIIEEVNSLSLQEQESMLRDIDASLLEKESGSRESALPDLEEAEAGEVVMRFAPGPSGPLHIGHSRVAILNDEYVKRYEGKLINRIEDTNPEKIDPEAYDMIPEDLEWLGVDVDETVIQSDRFEIYYEVARELLRKGKAYVCTCEVEYWRSQKERSLPCPHRDLTVEEEMEEFSKMLSGDYSQGEAAVVVKTDLHHPNPAIRDFVALRIVDSVSHPRTGDKYSVYPMMNLSVAVDDHHLGLTHVLRGKDHLNNTLRQKFIFDYMGWETPQYYHYGFVSVPETMLKTSLIKQGIEDGTYSGWDDVRLGTIRALGRRGISPQAIRDYWIECGLKEVDIQFSWENLYAFNKEVVDERANRYFFVEDPVLIQIHGVDQLRSKAPLHPDEPERGYREHSMEGAPIEVYITEHDSHLLEEGKKVRLKDLCNVERRDEEVRYIGNDLSILKEGASIIHWVPEENMRAVVLMNDGSQVRGLSEPIPDHERGQVIQFERFGFVKVEETRPIVQTVFTQT